MAEVNAEGINIAAAEETSQGDSPPPTTGWLNLEADAIGNPGPQYKKLARSPFTITRQLRRPFISGLDCALSLDVDAIKDHVDFFGEAIFKSVWKHSGGTGQSKFLVSAADADSFTVAAAGDFAAGSLVVTRGFTNPENNGLFVVDSGSSTTDIPVTATLVVEASPPANATLDFAGFQFDVGDLELDADGNLTTTTKDFTDFDISVHQWIYLPSPSEVDLPHHFDTDGYYGYAEVIDVATNKLTLRRRGWEVGAPDDGSGKAIRLFFTKWVRDVARSHEDEKLVSHAFEVTYPGLAAGPADSYEYLLGYMLNETTFEMPAEGKVAMKMTFIGTTSSDPTTDREDGPDDALNVVTSLAVSTSSDINRLSVDNVDESGLMTDFADLKIMIKNNIAAKKAVGHLGNRFTPLGVFEAQTEAQVYFTDPEVVTAVHDNRILRVAAGMRNDDFGMLIDIPSTGEMEAPKTIAHNDLVTIASKISGFIDSLSGFTAALSVFAFLPTRAPGIET